MRKKLLKNIQLNGFKGIYVPNAIVYNHGPDNLSDLIKQRRRIYAGHVELNRKKNYDVPTLSNIKILNALKKINHNRIKTFLCIVIEAYSRFLGWTDYYFLNKKHIVWEISESTKCNLSKSDFSDTTVIIPTLNEEQNIGDLINTIQNSYPRIYIIVSDDGSKDKTQEIVLKLILKNNKIQFIDRSQKIIKGLTASVIDAIEKVNTDKFIVIDGDFQHPPEKIRDISCYLENYDIVVAKRKKVAKWNLYRRSMSYIATSMAEIRILFKKTKCKDIMSGFFGMKTKYFKRIIIKKTQFQLDGYKILFDFFKINKEKLDVKEIEYDFGMRKGGKSKIGKKQIKAFLRSLFR
jgi:dolichol-phosphate mannosyltransferase